VKRTLWLCMVAVLCFDSGFAQQTPSNSSSVAVPHLVQFNGVVRNNADKPLTGMVEITFAFYEEQEGGAALWLETQNVDPDKTGRYTVLLGSTSSTGLPSDLFVSGEARWLGVQVQGQAEQPRVLLLSVPYALKAGDAQTIGGLPPSAFVLAAPANSGTTVSESAPVSAGTASAAVQPPATGNTPVTTAGGTSGRIPVWDSTSDITSSVISQSTSGSVPQISVNGTLALPNNGTATKTSGKKSRPLTLIASAYNSTTAAAVNQVFQWQSEPAHNNTSTPSGTLNLLFATGTSTPAETGLNIASNGLITFANGQSFPGTGSVTSVGLSAPSSDFSVSGSPVTSSGTLGLAWKVAPTKANTANAIVKRDANGAFSSGEITAASVGTATAALTATNSVAGYGVLGFATGSSGQGVWGEAFGTQFSANGQGADGVHGQSHTHNGSGVAGLNSDATGIGVYGQGTGFYSSGSGYGVFGVGSLGVYGASNNGSGYGVEGTNSAGNGTGVFGYGAVGGYFLGLPLNQVTGPGALLAQGATNTDYYGEAGAAFYGGAGSGGFAGGDGLYAYAGNPGPSYAGVFFGDVSITGTLSKGGGSFKIDHPLDPANKYLSHSFVESPDMMNVYNGNVVLDEHGTATIQLPDWFETLNRDFRYQLTSIGGFAPVYISQKVQDNAFKIAGGTPGMEVSWQVTGIRQDKWANAHRIPVEQQKNARERGFYLHPELYGQPAEKGMQWARDPEGMKRMSRRLKQPMLPSGPTGANR